MVSIDVGLLWDQRSSSRWVWSVVEGTCTCTKCWTKHNQHKHSAWLNLVGDSWRQHFVVLHTHCVHKNVYTVHVHVHDILHILACTCMLASYTPSNSRQIKLSSVVYTYNTIHTFWC